MKRSLLCFCMAVALAFSACGTSETVDVKNGYESNGNGNIEWFDLTPELFIEQLNERITPKGYPELKPLNDTNRMYSVNGNTWYILVESRSGSLDPEAAKGKVYTVELSLYAEDQERAKMNGEYINALIDMFSPGIAEQVAKELYVFEDPPQGTPELRKADYGNVTYAYIDTATGTPRFTVSPAEIKIASQENVKPVKPS